MQAARQRRQRPLEAPRRPQATEITHSICARCGFTIPMDQPTCPGCGRPAIADWKKRAKEIRRARRAGLLATKRSTEEILAAEGYRSLLWRAHFARSAATAFVLAATLLVANLVTRVLFDETDLGERWTLPEWVAEATPGLLAATVIAGGLAALTFMAWSFRAYRNLPALGAEGRRFWSVWIILAWFIPIVSFVIPKLMMDDIWRGSSLRYEPGTEKWKERTVGDTVHWWWALLTVFPVLTGLGLWLSIEEAGGDLELDTLTFWAVLWAVNVVAAGRAARRLVGVITVSQARRADMVVDVRSRSERMAARRQPPDPSFWDLDLPADRGRR